MLNRYQFHPSAKQSKHPNQRYNTLADAVLIGNNNSNGKELHSNESLIWFFGQRGPDLLSKYGPDLLRLIGYSYYCIGSMELPICYIHDSYA